MDKRMKILTFAAPDELVAALEAISKREYVPVSVVIRANLFSALRAEIEKAQAKNGE